MLHELMTRSMHPIGTHSGDWHRRINPGFNRWQDNDRWRTWVKPGCPVAAPLPHVELVAIVKACLAVEPAACPSLGELRDRLLCALFARSDFAGAQVDLFLRTAECEADGGNGHTLKAVCPVSLRRSTKSLSRTRRRSSRLYAGPERGRPA